MLINITHVSNILKALTSHPVKTKPKNNSPVEQKLKLINTVPFTIRPGLARCGFLAKKGGFFSQQSAQTC